MRSKPRSVSGATTAATPAAAITSATMLSAGESFIATSQLTRLAAA